MVGGLVVPDDFGEPPPAWLAVVVLVVDVAVADVAAEPDPPELPLVAVTEGMVTVLLPPLEPVLLADAGADVVVDEPVEPWLATVVEVVDGTVVVVVVSLVLGVAPHWETTV